MSPVALEMLVSKILGEIEDPEECVELGRSGKDAPAVEGKLEGRFVGGAADDSSEAVGAGLVAAEAAATTAATVGTTTMGDGPAVVWDGTTAGDVPLSA